MSDGLSNWFTGVPTETGWFEVKWKPENEPEKVYVRRCFKADYADTPDVEEDFSVWGWDEQDDPEG